VARKPLTVKRLPESVALEVRLKNQDRLVHGMTPILIKIVPCRYCSNYFESAGEKSCGCKASETAAAVTSAAQDIRLPRV
jgi:hypothetical protein